MIRPKECGGLPPLSGLRQLAAALMFCLPFLIAATSFAALSPQHVAWGEGPARHLMTKDDLARWQTLTTDEEARTFIDLFWARRDPTPDTPRNEFQEEFDARVLKADVEFTSPRMRGAMTDRGKVLILLGPPWQIGSRGAEMRSQSARPMNPREAWDGNVLSARAEPARQTWIYGYDKKPKFIKQKELMLLFVEENRDDWQLALNERANPAAILNNAVQSFIVTPGLTKAPSFTAPAPVRLQSFSIAGLQATYEAARMSGDSPAPAHLTWGEFVSPAGDGFVSLQLYVPASSGLRRDQPMVLFGGIEADGKVVEVFEMPVTLNSSGTDGYAERMVRLDPGQYTAIVGLASADAKPLAITRANVNVKGLDAKQPGVSDLFLSTNIVPLQHAWGPMDPFTFGGLKVVAKGDALFPTKGDLWYFVEMRNPGLTPHGAPSVQVKVDISGKAGDRAVRMNLPLADAEITKLKGTENRYAVGMAIPLESFRPGEYTMKLTLVDSVLSRNYEFEKKFRVDG